MNVDNTIILVLVVILLILLFWPKRGIIAGYKKFKISKNKIQLEDALKHIFDYQYQELKPTINSIAGNLNLSADKASRVVANLKRLNLIVINDQGINLTESGNSYALRIIRIHRLWESYLAEEIGMSELDWHDQAELIEHIMTEEEADILSAKLGNPKYDPHGDPIPSTEGILPQKEGLLLNEVNLGNTVKVLHIEDEPKAIYTQLVQKKYFPGKIIKVLKKSDEIISLATDGVDEEISPLLASNIRVKLIAQNEYVSEKQKTLLNLNVGETAKVINILPICRGQQRRRLLDFGIVPGTEISVLMKSPLNDPIAFVVKDTIVALRKEQASQILITV